LQPEAQRKPVVVRDSRSYPEPERRAGVGVTHPTTAQREKPQRSGHCHDTKSAAKPPARMGWHVAQRCAPAVGPWPDKPTIF